MISEFAIVRDTEGLLAGPVAEFTIVLLLPSPLLVLKGRIGIHARDVSVWINLRGGTCTHINGRNGDKEYKANDESDHQEWSS